MRGTGTHTAINKYPHKRSETTVLKLICWLMQLEQFTITQTARTALCMCSTSSPVMGGSPPRPWERDCGCSHVYVWEISNDERMPFQVWAGGASVQCPTLSPYTQRHTHTLPSQAYTLTTDMVIQRHTDTDTHTDLFYSHLRTYCTFSTACKIWASHRFDCFYMHSFIQTASGSCSDS